MRESYRRSTVASLRHVLFCCPIVLACGGRLPKVAVPRVFVEEQCGLQDRSWNSHYRSDWQIARFSMLNADAASTCGRVDGQWRCWGRPEQYPNGVAEISVVTRGEFRLDAVFLWSAEITTFQQLRLSTEAGQARAEAHVLRQLMDARRPRGFRCGWDRCLMENGQFVTYALAEGGAQRDANLFTPGDGVTQVRTAQRVCTLDQHERVHCRARAGVQAPAIAVDTTNELSQAGNAHKIAATENAVCVLLENQELWCSLEAERRLSAGAWTLQLSHVTDFVCTRTEICALTDDHVVACRTNAFRSSTLGFVPWVLPAPVHQIVAGEEHICVLDDYETAWCWGEPSFGRLATTPPISTPHAVDVPGRVRFAVTGWGHSCALTEENQVYCWGLAYDGQTGDLQAILPRATGNIGRYRTTAVPHRVPFALTITRLESFERWTCASHESQRWCWGAVPNAWISGIATQQGETVCATPTLVRQPAAQSAHQAFIEQTQASYAHQCEVRDDHQVYCRGNNSHGQVGAHAYGLDEWVSVPGLRTMVGVTVGAAHTCAWNKCGSLFCWGSNDYQQLGVFGRRDPRVPQPVLSSAVSEVSPRESPQ